MSELMKRLSGRQAAFTNKLEGRCGSLWQGRFKASHIQRDEYLLSCIRYGELNPVRAAMVNAPGNYPWSSYNVRMGQHCGPASSAILDFDACCLGLAETELTRRCRYREFLSLPMVPEDQKLIRQGVQRNQLTGNTRFADEIERRTGLRIQQRGPGRPPVEQRHRAKRERV